MSQTTVAPLAAALLPLSPLALRVRRAVGSLVGRPAEVAAIEQEMAAAAEGRLSSITLEGEPGIGKTRLLLTANELAEARGFVSIAVTADEELRGPFLLARAIIASPAASQAAAGTSAEEALGRCHEALLGKDDPGLEGLPSGEKLLRTYDLAALALRCLAEIRPVAMLVDDVQWADEDSIRMLRYIVRADSGSPIFLMLATRPEETALVNEAVNLIADMERLGLVRRLKLGRFTQVEAAQFLHQALGGRIDPTSAAAMHAQSEGVPFILEEVGNAYREAGMIQQIDGVWTLARNAGRLVPSAVRTLIQRRAARLPDGTRTSLGEAAVLGRSFSLRDLRAVKILLHDEECEAARLADHLAPAVQAGLLVQHPAGSPADYGFTHEQVREFALAALTTPRRRAIHAAIVDLLTADGEPSPASLGMVAHHALAAGDTARAPRFSIAAARAALEAHAAEEALRVVDEALPASPAAQDRVALLCAQDEALEMLGRSGERLQGLAELAALAEALADSHVELDVMLRRAAALRLADDQDRAAQLARRVRDLARERGDRRAELAASLELGQDLLRTPLGEGYSPTTSEVDLDGADEAFQRALAVAEEIGDEGNVAAALRELGTISVARLRDWFVERIKEGAMSGLMARIAGGETVDEILPTLPVFPIAQEAMARYERALGIYERLGDRRGVMSTVIAMAYISWAPDIHLTSSARRIEEIRRLATRMKSLSTESERALADLQMLYGVHVYARAKVVPDLALARGEETYHAARALGDRPLEFLSAGGLALAHLEMDEVRQAEGWLEKAAAAAQASPTPLRARQVEFLRGVARAAAGDGAGMREHLERAVRMAGEQGRPAARCEALARLALEAARLGAEHGAEDDLSLAERSATEAKSLLPPLGGHPPWGAQADAAMAMVHSARGEMELAADAARSAVSALEKALTEDLHLEILLPVATVLTAAGSEEERSSIRQHVQVVLATIAQRTLDEDVRVRWFRGSIARRLAALAGPLGPATGDGAKDREAAAAAFAEEEVTLLRLLTEGRTNAEIAKELALAEDVVVRRLAEIFAKIGASSRAEATTFAFHVV